MFPSTKLYEILVNKTHRYAGLAQVSRRFHAGFTPVSRRFHAGLAPKYHYCAGFAPVSCRFRASFAPYMPVWRQFGDALAPKWHSVLGPVSYQFRAGFTPVSRRFHTGCYTRKRTLTNGDISWRCSKRRCKRVLRTAADLEFKSTFPEKEHTCPALTDDEVFKMVGDDILVNSRYCSTMLQLARDFNHPDSRNLYKRRWRKSRASSGGSF